MIYEAIQGILKEKSPMKVVIETNGIFYRIMIPVNAFAKLPSLDQSIYLLLSFVVREDSQTLYGFCKKEERDLFEHLITLSGIGPKTALGIVGHMEIDLFHQAISSGNVALLHKIPGIGKKTAERLIIEMRDQLKTKQNFSTNTTPSLVTDGIQALMHLGYNLMDAKKAIDSVLQEKKEEKDLASLITSALQKI